MTENIVICRPQPENLPQMQALWRASFEEDRESDFVPWYFANRYDPAHAWLLFKDGELAAMTYAPTVSVSIGEQTVSVPYVQGVATAEKFRRHGLCRRLLNAMHEDLRSEGFPFCILKPFRADFYEPLGYRFFARLRRYNLDFNEHFLLPPNFINGDFQLEHYLYPPHAAAELAAVYAGWTAGFSCRALRNVEACRLLLDDHLADRGMLLLARLGNEPVAYALYTTTPDGLFIRELAYTRRRAAKELLAALAHDYREDTPKCVIIMPDDERTCSLLPQTNEGWQVLPFAMLKPLTKPMSECYNSIMGTSAYFYEYF
jgi:predicted acetyltransferase